MLKVIQHLANIAVAIFRVSVYWLGIFWKPFMEQAAGSEWDMMKLTGGVDKQAAIQLDNTERDLFRKPSNYTFLQTQLLVLKQVFMLKI
jgi:hypothetical protein